jgi:hypothetical protein
LDDRFPRRNYFFGNIDSTGLEKSASNGTDNGTVRPDKHLCTFSARGGPGLVKNGGYGKALPFLEELKNSLVNVFHSGNPVEVFFSKMILKALHLSSSNLFLHPIMSQYGVDV